MGVAERDKIGERDRIAYTEEEKKTKGRGILPDRVKGAHLGKIRGTKVNHRTLPRIGRELKEK